MSSKKKQPNLKTLTQKWYKKLEQAGFKDIEDTNGNLKTYASSFQYKTSPDSYVSKQRYYELAGQLTFSGYLTDSRDLEVWRLHAEGRTATEIHKKTGISLRVIRETVNDIQRRYIKAAPR